MREQGTFSPHLVPVVRCLLSRLGPTPVRCSALMSDSQEPFSPRA
jgi:hypothetical protein